MGVYCEKGEVHLKMKAEPILLKFIQDIMNFILQGFFRDPSCSLELLVSSGTKVLWEFLHYVSVRKSQLLASRT